jgi:hypothetical protein
MAERDTKRDAPAATGDELAPEDTSSEETRSARPDAEPAPPGGKGTATDEEIVGCAADTIPLDDGSYLEPPD